MKEKHPQNRDYDWKVFLQKLAPQFIQNIDNITITEDTASFEIKADQKEILEQHFNAVLTNSESLQAQLSYAATRSAQSSAIDSASSDVSAMPTVTNLQEAYVLMRTLFGKDTMKGRNKRCPVNFDTYLSQFENGLLISSDPFESESLALAQRGQNFLCAHFNGISIHDIRKLLSQPGSPLKTPDELKEGEGFVQRCFGIIRNPDDNTYRMYFDVAKFLQLVYPPQLVCEQSKSDSEKWRVTISLYHLMLYMKQLSQGLLFDVELKHGRVHAYPLLLAHKRTMEKPLIIYMVLDDSGSMEKCREQLFANIQVFLQDVTHVKLLNVTLNIRLFSAQGEFLSYNGPIELFNAKEFFRGELGHTTALFDAIDCSLTDMQKTLNTHNNLFVILTDGRDNASQITEKIILEKIKKVSSAVLDEGAPPPHMYVMGCGEVNERVLTDLAKRVGQSQYIAVSNQEAFGPLISNIHSFEHELVLGRFTTQIEGESVQQYCLPIALTDAPKVIPQVIIPLSQKRVTVSFDSPTMGQELALGQVTLQITSSDAQIAMEQYAGRIREIYSAKTNPVQRIAQLNELGGEIDEFCKKAPQAIVLSWATDLHKEIEDYTAELREQCDRSNETASSSVASSSASSGSPSCLGRDSPILSPKVGVQTIETEKRTSLSPLQF